MAIRSLTEASRRGEPSRRRTALATAVSLLLTALLAPFAQFGVLQTLVVPADAAATTNNIAASLGPFQAAIVAFLIVAILDVVVALGLYALLRPVNAGLALFTGSLRIAYAAVFVFTMFNLLEAAQLVSGATASALQSVPLQAQVAASVGSFDTGWHLALGIFGLHLIGLGTLLFRFTAPRLLAALVVLAGLGYLADAIGTILITDYRLTISTFTFVGEALLIFWLFWRAARGSRSSEVGAPDDASPVAARPRASGLPVQVDRVLRGIRMCFLQPHHSDRSPVPAILASLVGGAVLAVTLVVTLALGGSEPTVTGSVLVAFGLGWGLMAILSTRFSAQPQGWAAVPAAFLASIGLGLIAFQPGPAAMNVLGWVWPPALAGLAVWMVVHVRRHLRGRGRWLAVPMIVTLLAFAVGGGLAFVGAATGTSAPTATGRLIDVGGHRLHIECTGKGGPAVVLQAGLGGSSSSWAKIAPAIAATTTVCAYDRAGHGQSDEAAGPQDGIALATDLHTLLERAGVPGPYVLVGHSSGGPYVRVFAAQYPDEVAGMVLLDAQPSDVFTALPGYPGVYATFRTVATISPSLARIGLLGLLLGLPADQSTVAVARGARDEVFALPTVLRQSSALTSLGDRSLVVVTAVAEAPAGWLAAQDSLPRLSTVSVHRVMANATHNSLISGVDAPASTQAILDVLSSIRTGTALR
jgi:pimeloyl-ACP methyl ester carboxylesterase